MRAVCPIPPLNKHIWDGEYGREPHSVGVEDGKLLYHYVVPGIMIVCPGSGMPVEEV